MQCFNFLHTGEKTSQIFLFINMKQRIFLFKLLDFVCFPNGKFV